MRISREPALALIAALAPLVQLLASLFLPLTIGQQGALNAVAVAVAGAATAVVVRSDRLAPALLGLAQAVLALALAFGWALTPGEQAGVMTLAGILVAAFVRTQVVAPTPPEVAAARGALA